MMPFSSLSDPVDLARATAALEAAWAEIKPTIPNASLDQERARLAFIISSFAVVAMDEEDLKRRAIERFKQ